MPSIYISDVKIGFHSFLTFQKSQVFKSGRRALLLMVTALLVVPLSRWQTPLTTQGLLIYSVSSLLSICGACLLGYYLASKDWKRLYEVSPGLQDASSFMLDNNRITVDSLLFKAEIPWERVKFYLIGENILAFNTGSNFNFYLHIPSAATKESVLELFQAKGIHPK